MSCLPPAAAAASHHEPRAGDRHAHGGHGTALPRGTRRLFGDVKSADSPPNGRCSNPGFWQQSWPLYLQRAGYNTGIFGKAYHMGGDAPCGHAQHNQSLWYGPPQPEPWTGARPGIPVVATNTTPLFMLPGWDRHFVYCYPLDQYFW